METVRDEFCDTSSDESLYSMEENSSGHTPPSNSLSQPVLPGNRNRVNHRRIVNHNSQRNHPCTSQPVSKNENKHVGSSHNQAKVGQYATLQQRIDKKDERNT